MPKFRKIPIVVEAVKVSEIFNALGRDNAWAHLPTWLNKAYTEGDINICENPIQMLLIHTLEGDMAAGLEDWIVQGAVGEIYPCKPHAFENTFELI